MYDLSGQTAFVTGATSGIGEACAHAFARAGARLLLAGRRRDRLHAVAEALETAYDAPVHALVLDVRRQTQVELAVASLPEAWQRIDILVNNAGLSRGMDPLHRQPVEDIDQMIDTNLKGLLYVTRAVVAGMARRDHGHVVNIGSTAGHGVYPGGVVYCAAKHAVDAVTRGLKMDLHGTRVRVTSVDPGLTETEFSLVRFSGDRARADAVYQGMQPLSADDVADAVLYCVTRPAHVNVADLILMPVDQSGTMMVHRRTGPAS